MTTEEFYSGAVAFFGGEGVLIVGRNCHTKSPRYLPLNRTSAVFDITAKVTSLLFTVNGAESSF